MKILEIVKALDLLVVAGHNSIDTDAGGVYICDLLSWVMSHAQRRDIWITVQSNINIVAIASLLELACILIPEDIKVDDVTVKKADEKGVVILSSSMNSYTLGVKLSEILKCE